MLKIEHTPEQLEYKDMPVGSIFIYDDWFWLKLKHTNYKLSEPREFDPEIVIIQAPIRFDELPVGKFFTFGNAIHFKSSESHGIRLLDGALFGFDDHNRVLECKGTLTIKLWLQNLIMLV